MDLSRICTHVWFRMQNGPRFRACYKSGDGPWAASVEVEFSWRGRHYWHCWFLPWMPDNASVCHERSELVERDGYRNSEMEESP